MQFNPSAGRSRLGVRVLCFSVKAYPDGASAIANTQDWIHSLLRHGSNVKAFNGTIEDYLLPLNTDVVTVHMDKRFTITQPFLWNTSLSPDGTTIPVQQAYSTKTWRANIKCKNKVLKFSAPAELTPSGSIPNNWGPLFALGYCHLDGSAPDQLTTAVSNSFLSTIRYEDR